MAVVQQGIEKIMQERFGFAHHQKTMIVDQDWHGQRYLTAYMGELWSFHASSILLHLFLPLHPSFLLGFLTWLHPFFLWHLFTLAQLPFLLHLFMLSHLLAMQVGPMYSRQLPTTAALHALTFAQLQIILILIIPQPLLVHCRS